jgi:glycosyltransferase involved in cell wall biosynthesis
MPVIATGVTGIPALVEDGTTGLLVDERDPAWLAAAIQRLLNDRTLATDLASAARRRVEERFDLRTNVARLRALFAESTVAAAAPLASAPAEVHSGAIAAD